MSEKKKWNIKGLFVQEELTDETASSLSPTATPAVPCLIVP